MFRPRPTVLHLALLLLLPLVTAAGQSALTKFGTPAGSCRGETSILLPGEPMPGLCPVECLAAPPKAPGMLVIGSRRLAVPQSLGGYALYLDHNASWFAVPVVTDGEGVARYDLQLTPAMVGGGGYLRYWFFNPSSCPGTGTLSASDVLAVPVHAKASNTVHRESFDSLASLGAGGWTLLQQDPLYKHSLAPYAARGQVVQMGGGTHNQGAAMIHSLPFAHSNVLVINFDFYLVSQGWHYTDVYVGLARGWGITQWSAFQNFALLFTASKGYPDKRSVDMVVNGNTPAQERLTLAGAYRSDFWNRGTLEILPGGRVRFFVNGKHLFTSKAGMAPHATPLTLTVMGNSGGGMAYLDNLRITHR